MVSLLLVQVLGSAVTVFNDVCPERLELLHPYFRTLCQILPDVDEWGQIEIMQTLLRYARTQFLDPKADVPVKKAKASSDSDSGAHTAARLDVCVCACVHPMSKQKR